MRRSQGESHLRKWLEPQSDDGNQVHFRLPGMTAAILSLAPWFATAFRTTTPHAGEVGGPKRTRCRKGEDSLGNAAHIG